MLKPAERGRTSGMQGAMQGVAATIRKVPAHSQWGLLISVQSRSFTHRLCPVAPFCNFKTQPVPRQCPTCLVLSSLSLSRSLFPTKHTPTHLQQSTHSTTTKPAHRSISAQRLLPAPGSPVDLPLLFILYTITFQPYIHTLALLCLSISPSAACSTKDSSQQQPAITTKRTGRSGYLPVV